MSEKKVFDSESNKYHLFWKSKNVNRKEQHQIVWLLAEHFKTSLPLIENSCGALNAYQSPSALGKATIFLSNPTWLGELCHEYAHHLNFERNKRKGHGATYQAVHQEVFDYAARFLNDKQ